MTKAKRDIRSFEADKDVSKEIDKATKRGIKLKFLCNEALRRYLKPVKEAA